MAGNFVPCLLKDGSEEANGAMGCVIIEGLFSFLALLFCVYGCIICCFGRANEVEEFDPYASLRLRLGSEDEDGQSGGEDESMDGNIETVLLGHGASYEAV